MKIKNPFSDLSRFELVLWLVSVLCVCASYLVSGSGGVMAIFASVMGVTALIFVAKGYVLGQALTIVFSALYGIISFSNRYYGEMITYLGMTAPMAAVSMIVWLRHPYEGSNEVEVNSLTKKQALRLIIYTIAVTAAFFFVLKALGSASLLVSTISVATSFIASYLTFCRSPYYAAGYAANDIVLIVLWTIAAFEDVSYVPMIICFVMFLANDIYGFYNWRRIRQRQSSSL